MFENSRMLVGFLLRLPMSFVQRRMECHNMDAPRYDVAVIVVTKRCNLNCKDCFVRNAPHRNYEMTCEQFEHILQTCSEDGLRFRRMVFTGGEPTVWPHLAWAVRKAKDSGLARSVEVCTNAIKEGITVADYGYPDLIDITCYGALNAYNALSLRREYGRKVHYRQIAHLPYPYQVNPTIDPLPAHCNCTNLTFEGDHVYRCTIQARENYLCVPVETGFMDSIQALDPRRSEVCKTCISNRKLRDQVTQAPVISLAIWHTRVHWLWQPKGKWLKLRHLFRHYAMRRNLK